LREGVGDMDKREEGGRGRGRRWGRGGRGDNNQWKIGKYRKETCVYDLCTYLAFSLSELMTSI
jgi:hypothetical protein